MRAYRLLTFEVFALSLLAVVLYHGCNAADQLIGAPTPRPRVVAAPTFTAGEYRGTWSGVPYAFYFYPDGGYRGGWISGPPAHPVPGGIPVVQVLDWSGFWRWDGSTLHISERRESLEPPIVWRIEMVYDRKSSTWKCRAFLAGRDDPRAVTLKRVGPTP